MTPICSSTFAFCLIPILFPSSELLPDAIRRLPDTSARFLRPRNSSSRISDLLIYLLPHYIQEGKSYLTIAFGCTGGQHRSVMIAEDVGKRLRKAKYRVKVEHRDSPK